MPSDDTLGPDHRSLHTEPDLAVSWYPGPDPTAPPARPQEPDVPTRRTARGPGRAATARAPVELALDVATARRWMWRAAAVLVTLDVLASVGDALGAPYLMTRFFDGDYKVNFPTGYKLASLLGVTLLCALLYRIARREAHRFAAGWLLLALVSGFACLDETVWLHQTLSEFLHNHFNTSGPLRYAWTIVYLPAAIAVFLILLRHLKDLAPSLRWPLLAGGGLYGTGAVLLEPVKSHFAETAGEHSLSLKLSAAASDSAQMLGLTFLAVVLLTELARRAGAVAVLLGEAPPVTPPRTGTASPT